MKGPTFNFLIQVRFKLTPKLVAQSLTHGTTPPLTWISVSYGCEYEYIWEKKIMCTANAYFLWAHLVECSSMHKAAIFASVFNLLIWVCFCFFTLLPHSNGNSQTLLDVLCKSSLRKICQPPGQKRTLHSVVYFSKINFRTCCKVETN